MFSTNPMPCSSAEASGDRVEPDSGEKQAEGEHRQALHWRLGTEPDERREREHEDREQLGRSELERLERDREREEREEDRRHERTEERRDERARESEPWLPEAFRKGEAVEEKHDRPRLAGDIEEDRGNDASEESAPVDPREEDDRGGRVRSR